MMWSQPDNSGVDGLALVILLTDLTRLHSAEAVRQTQLDCVSALPIPASISTTAAHAAEEEFLKSI